MGTSAHENLPVLFLCLCPSGFAQSAKHPFTFGEMMKPPRCFKPIRSVYDAANAEGAVENVVLARRRSLGAEAAEFAAVV